jgi:hypothetical protein
MPNLRLLTALEDAQIRRLEPHLYHLMLTGRPEKRAQGLMERAVEGDAAPDPFAVLVEPVAGWRSFDFSSLRPWRHACHVAIVVRSPILAGVGQRAADAMSKLAGGPEVAVCGSLEAAYASARRALARRAGEPAAE